MIYQIVAQPGGEVIETIDMSWEDAQKHLKQLRALGRRCLIRKPKVPIAALRQNGSEVPKWTKFGTFLIGDCWTSGNPGLGGYQIMLIELTEDGVKSSEVVLSRDFTEKHTNNYYELAAIGAAYKEALKYAVLDGIFSDSETAISWVNSGKHNAKYDIETIDKAISVIRELKQSTKVELLHWDKNVMGMENPADYGRK